ncbi:MAG: DegT/DnrJ/EryC1/StrS family aminotransferase [candidate division NC10 bacterium]|nr:DegT/DnrJ/EryC1/StrS family aminotransferase [candidate division NC10 bacterium]
MQPVTLCHQRGNHDRPGRNSPPGPHRGVRGDPGRTRRLHLALRALGIGPGDEVIVPAFTFIATAEAVSYVGATPVFCDVDPRTFTLDPKRVEEAVTPRTRALLPVHLYGLPADLEALGSLAARHGLALIEDAAQAVGAERGGRRAGSVGLAGCLSFYPTKNLAAYGDAGMLVTSDAGLAARVRRLRNPGARERYRHEEVGFNSRLDELQAAILRVKLRHLDRWTERRRRIAAAYRAALADTPLTLPVEPAGCRHVYHQYTVRAPERDRFHQALNAAGIGSMIYYPVPLHRQPAYAALGYAEGSLPESERAAR